jgi:hypothetical protein
MNRRLELLPANSAESKGLDRKLTAYLAAAAAVGTTLATDADAAVVGNNTVVPFGINGAVPIDFNNDGNPEFEIDHDRLTDMGMETTDPSGFDFLQVDKNDQVELVLPGTSFPGGNTDAEYLTDVASNYPSALSLGDVIGPASPGVFQFQETEEDGAGFDLTRRSNRLIDEDNGVIDANVGTLVNPHVDTPNWLGLNGDVGYLGLRIKLGGDGDYHYGWVGVRVTDEADATGEVVGFAYNDVQGAPITAGAIPEPGTMALAALGGITLAGSWITRRFRK